MARGVGIKKVRGGGFKSGKGWGIKKVRDGGLQRGGHKNIFIIFNKYMINIYNI